MSLRFGTDGVRGLANVDLTPELVLALGRAAARVLEPGDTAFIVGRDTRASSPLLSAALAAGLAAEGVDVADAGVLPTPGVAWLSAVGGAPAAMISASHNPFPDNGIKFFAAGGRKLSDEVERALEVEVERVLATAAPEGAPDPGRPDPPRPVRGAAVGRITSLAATAPYEEALRGSLDGRRLDGLAVVLDCANGAASEVAPRVLRSLGARVEVIHDRPDGTNINAACGSTHPEELQRAVLATAADAGLAFDGDADRVIAVDRRGDLVDGDGLLALCAADLKSRGLLTGDTVVVTVMTNLGFHLAMGERGIRVEQTAVGDRYVLEALEQGSWSLGGEQSGHVIFRDHATTGDGILTGLQVLDVMSRTGRSLDELASIMTRLPQVLRNVGVADRDRLGQAEALWAEVRLVESELGSLGRVLLRPSGTEPIVRVMVEAQALEQAEKLAARLCEAVERDLG